MSETSGFKDSLLRAIAVIGLIAILVLGAWGIIQLVVGLPDFFSNFGFSVPSSLVSNSGEHLVVTAPKNATSDQAVTLSWTHTGGSGNYSYAISYACATGLSFAAPVPTGQMQIVPCNTPFNFTNATKTIQLIPVLHTASAVTTSFTVLADRLTDGKITTTSTSTTMTVSPGATTQVAAPATTQSTTATSPATTYTASGHTSNLYGSADLSVTLISVTPSNGRYYAQFSIQNSGTNVAPAGWHFNAVLPTAPTYTFVSEPQRKLYPGDEIVYTLGFDIPAPAYSDTYNPYTNTPTVLSIIVDPHKTVSDSDRTNNSVTVPFSAY